MNDNELAELTRRAYCIVRNAHVAPISEGPAIGVVLSKLIEEAERGKVAQQLQRAKP